jgi:hypothetical protein
MSNGWTFAQDTHRLFRRDAEGVDQPADFASGVLDRLARLDAQGKGQFLEAFLEALDAMGQHVLAFVRRHPRHRLGGFHAGGNPSVNRRRVGQRHPGRHFSGIFVDDFQILVGGFGFVRQIIGIGILQSLFRFWHCRLKPPR